MKALATGWMVVGLLACGIEPQASDGALVREYLSVVDIHSDRVLATSQAEAFRGRSELVHLQGKLNFFGVDLLADPPAPRPYARGVAGAKVWIAEYPFTQDLNLTSDENGYWELWIVKHSGIDLSFSFVYEKDFYPAEIEELIFPAGIPTAWSAVTIQSNTYTVGDQDILDVAIQVPDELYLFYAKTQLEMAIGEIVGTPYPINNILVSTVGKAWASLFDMRLPHGDPGAIVTLAPASVLPSSGPVYFDETVTPNPQQSLTSADGGVLFNNLAAGTYIMRASKEGVTYDEVVFKVGAEVNVYVSSPPHSLQGTNDSDPGEP
jgi:hypothetical protein